MADRMQDLIRERTTAALKAGDATTVATLRMLTAAIVLREKEVGHDLDEDEIREVAAKEVKKRTESIEAFTDAGRTELADKEAAERAVLEPYAPARLDEAEVDAIIDEVIASTGASEPGDMGRVMGAVMARAKGQVDGKAVQAKVRAKLGG